MSVTLRIDVKREHIDNGKSAKNDSCAFALAVRDIFPNAKVYPSEILPFEGDYFSPRTKRFSISKEMEHFINIFDNADKAEEKAIIPEQSFELDIPDHVIDRVGNMDEVRAIIAGSKVLELVNA